MNVEEEGKSKESGQRVAEGTGVPLHALSPAFAYVKRSLDPAWKIEDRTSEGVRGSVSVGGVSVT